MRRTSAFVLVSASSQLLAGCYDDDVLATVARQSGGGDEVCADQLSRASAQPRSATCPLLAAPRGPVVCVTPARAAELAQIVASAAQGSTILLADGTYGGVASAPVPTLTFRAPGVTLRSASGRAERVILDGQYSTEVLLDIAASDVVVADVTLQHALHHAVHVTAPTSASVQGVQLYGLRVLDHGNRMLKVDSAAGAPDSSVDSGALSCSTLELSAEGRARIQPTETECDTGGLFATRVRGWTVRDNTFRGIYCSTGGVASHAVHFSEGSRESLVERNLIVDCARGVGFGSQAPGQRLYDDDPYPGVSPIAHYDGIIRNNVIVAGIAELDTGIELAQARGALVLHNSVFHPEAAFSSIDYRFANTLVRLSNNLVVRLTERDQGQAEQAGNLAGATSELFVDAAGGDLHLAGTAASAIDQGVVLPDAGSDIDGALHDVGGPDIGADEFGAP